MHRVSRSVNIYFSFIPSFLSSLIKKCNRIKMFTIAFLSRVSLFVGLRVILVHFDMSTIGQTGRVKNFPKDKNLRIENRGEKGGGYVCKDCVHD